MKFILTATIFSVFCTRPTLAAELAGAMTLDGVLETVRVSNPELAAMRGRLAVLEGSWIKTGAYPNPSIEIERSQPDPGQASEFKLTQPVIVTNRRSLAKGAAQAEIEVFKREIASKEASLSASAKKAYYAFRLAEAQVKFEDSNRAFAVGVLNKVQARCLVGDARNVDVARAKVELDQATFNLEAARARVLMARASLNRAMGRRPDEPLSFPAEDPLVLQPPEDTGDFQKYLEEALSSRRDIQAAGLRSQGAELSLRMERNRRIPDFFVGFARSRESDVNFNKFSLGVELPLWYSNRGEIAGAKAEVAARQEQKRAIERHASFEVYSSWLGRNLARSRVSAARRNVLAVDELREVNSRDYLSGKIDLTAYYEGNRVFLEQNINHLDALQEYHDKDVELEQVLSASLEAEQEPR